MPRRPSPGIVLAWMLFAFAASGSSLRAYDQDPPAPTADESAAKVEPKTDAPAPSTKPAVDRGRLARVFSTANPLLWPLAACSILTVGFTLERFLALRRKRVVPPEFVERFLDRLAAGRLDRDRALELCRANDNTSARVFAHVARAWGLPGATIREMVAYDSAGEVVEMKRNLRVLSAMATLGPLLGLLGTVVGIIQSFDALGGRAAGPSRGEALAEGISLALVATAFGLGIAIFAVVAYYVLLNRLEVLVRELDDKTRQAIDLVAVDAVHPVSIDRRPMPTAPPSPPSAAVEPSRPQESQVF